MPNLEDDDYRLVLVAVLTTVILGFFIYVFSGPTRIQVASRLPFIEKTVPTIVPNQPRM